MFTNSTVIPLYSKNSYFNWSDCSSQPILITKVKQISSIRHIWVVHRDRPYCAHPKMKSYTCVTSPRRKSARKFKRKLLRQATKKWAVAIIDHMIRYKTLFKLSEIWMWVYKLETYVPGEIIPAHIRLQINFPRSQPIFEIE